MLCNFYGKVLIEPTEVEHNSGCLNAMVNMIKDAIKKYNIADLIAAVEMTGVYHKPVQAALRKAGIDTRIVHPFASSHYRAALHPDNKTDDTDLEAIFHAAINGYGLATLPVSEEYKTLQQLVRHRRNLVKQRARLQTQIRVLMHQTMPGYVDLFDDKLFSRSIAFPVAMEYQSAKAIAKAGTSGICKYLKSQSIRFHPRTLERIVAWAATAADADLMATVMTSHWQQLIELHRMFGTRIELTERQTAHFLVKTPYCLLLSVTGINVVSAGELAGEAGPIEHYASSRAITGRAGLFPSRYQSDQVDRSGSVARTCNRRLRSACILIGKNLIKCNSYYRGLSALWATKNIAVKDRQCRAANRAMRMVFQIVSGRGVWRGKGVDRETILWKLREFHRVHHTDLDQTVVDMNAAFEWLPKSTHADEAKPLAQQANKRRRGTASIGDLLIPLLIRLGAMAPDPVDCPASEA